MTVPFDPKCLHSVYICTEVTFSQATFRLKKRKYKFNNFLLLWNFLLQCFHWIIFNYLEGIEQREAKQKLVSYCLKNLLLYTKDWALKNMWNMWHWKLKPIHGTGKKGRKRYGDWQKIYKYNQIILDHLLRKKSKLTILHCKF